ncbi:MAG: helix-turn-helix domain-containing protein [Chthoniobacterales bacterium]
MNTLTQPLSLGAILAQAREAKGVSLEQAARDTKIRASQLRDMEKDNISHFAHPSYARLFLRDYAKYLGLARPDVEDFLPESGECSSEGMEYLEGYSNEEKLGALLRNDTPVRRTSPLAVFGGVVLSLLVLSLAFYVWHLNKDLERANRGAQTPVMEQLDQKTLDNLKADKDLLTTAGVDDAPPLSSSSDKDHTTTPETSTQKAPAVAQPMGNEKKTTEAPAASGPLAAVSTAGKKP